MEGTKERAGEETRRGKRLAGSERLQGKELKKREKKGSAGENKRRETRQN